MVEGVVYLTVHFDSIGTLTPADFSYISTK